MPAVLVRLDEPMQEARTEPTERGQWAGLARLGTIRLRTLARSHGIGVGEHTENSVKHWHGGSTDGWLLCLAI